MSPPGCPKMWVKPCNRNAEESFPVLSLKSREQKPPNPLLIQDKNVLQPTSGAFAGVTGMSEGFICLKKPSDSVGESGTGDGMSAFTVAELGEMLPQTFNFGKGGQD